MLFLRSTAEGDQATGKGVLYHRRGIVRVTTENEIQPQPDGSVQFPGTFKIRGGSGRFKGARGGVDFDAVVPARGSVCRPPSSISGGVI